MRKALFVVCCFPFLAAAQPIGVGIKGGLPLNDTFDVVNSTNRGLTAENRLWIVGPQIELRLPAGLGIEFDALYTKVDFRSPLSAAGSIAGSVVDANSWEFPLLLKYKIGGNPRVAGIRPFVNAGASFRRLSDVGTISQFVTGQSGGSSNTATGFVVGGGLEVKVLFLHLTPEVRFTRWGTENLIEGASNIFRLNRNQAQFLVGFSF